MSREKKPLWERVPRGYLANLRYRKRILKEASQDAGLQAALKRGCQDDIVFWLHTFGWTYSPNQRLYPHPCQPLILYDCQVRAIQKIKASLGKLDLVIEKSRDMGASIICVMAFLHDWQFEHMRSFLLVSRKEDLVDKSGNPDTLFYKIDFALERQPEWLRPSIDRKLLSLVNLETGSSIDGSSSTSDTSRGGRRTAMLLDEFASDPNGYAVDAASRDVTPCRIFNSTPKGKANAFYEFVCKAERGDVEKIRMHWTEHPIKARGLYRAHEDGRVEHLDPDYEYPPDYPFKADESKLRSPWYDLECRRTSLPVLIAQELDIDYGGSDYNFFDGVEIDRQLAEDAKVPVWVGDVDAKSGEFLPREDGPLKLWIDPAKKTGGYYAMGVDVSAGTGASNSVAAIIERATGEKVGEFASTSLRPARFAEKCVALAKHFNNAYMAWEANGGPGRNFGDRVEELRYYEVYHRKSQSGRATEVSGWYSSPAAKASVLGELREAVHRKEFVNRSRLAIEEQRHYVYLSSRDAVEHARAASSPDPTGARSNHGDRVMADAIAWLARQDRPVNSQAAKPGDPGYSVPLVPGSFGWRAKMDEEKLAAAGGW